VHEATLVFPGDVHRLLIKLQPLGIGIVIRRHRAGHALHNDGRDSVRTTSGQCGWCRIASDQVAEWLPRTTRRATIHTARATSSGVTIARHGSANLAKGTLRQPISSLQTAPPAPTPVPRRPVHVQVLGDVPMGAGYIGRGLPTAPVPSNRTCHHFGANAGRAMLCRLRPIFNQSAASTARALSTWSRIIAALPITPD
jgi:hypothetical protein